MSKKKCCCGDRLILDEWCNHEHYGIDFWALANQPGIPNNPSYGVGDAPCKQPNWKSTGTLTTELPSIGHPMTGYLPCNGDEPFPNPESGRYEEIPPTNPIPILRNSFRTPSTGLLNNQFLWGPAGYYGDLSSCWFNGINMTNIENEDESFFNITFKLKIEKLVGSQFQEIIDTQVSGPARNLRPHPDAVRSYNVATDHANYSLASQCDVFFDDFEGGEPEPCYQDFARMPRGPWPYRFKRKLSIDFDNTNCFSRDQDGNIDQPYTIEQALALGLTECVVEGVCNQLDPDDRANCCQASYMPRNQYCTQLDPEKGTPFGWEDCPYQCQIYSNNSVIGNTGALRFFGWLEPANRYTTPEWDVYYDGDNSRKISLNVLVPTQFKESTAFCSPDIAEGRSFGEWSFGMDCEATEGEISALESAGFPWSDGREKDGIWLHKTPTNALRLLFTLDHADIDQGKVWRVFKDWNVKVTNYVKTFNAGTDQEVKFRINIEQKLEETFLSSLGCDCPSGYKISDDGTSLERITPAGCNDQLPGLETFGNLNDCSDGFKTGPDFHCMNSLNGTKISFCERGPLVLKVDFEASNFGCINCENPNTPNPTCQESPSGTTEVQGYEESQKGLKMIVNSGPNSANYLPIETNHRPLEFSGIYFGQQGGWTEFDGVSPCGARSLGGLEPNWAFPAIGDNRKAQNIPSSTYNLYYEHGSRYLGALADIPFPAGHHGSPVSGKRYRNNYSAVQGVDELDVEDYYYGWAPFGFYPHLYGDSVCRWTSQNCQQPDYPNPQSYAVPSFASFNVKQWPESAPKYNCELRCDECILPPRGCQDCSGPPNGGGNLCVCRSCCDCNDISPDQCPEQVSIGFNGLPCDPPCPTQPGTNLVNCCNDKPPNCCACPCDLLDPLCQYPSADAAQIGPYLNPKWECGENIGRFDGRGPSDPYWTCYPKWPDGEILPTGFGEGPAGGQDPEYFFGMDSERFYFKPLGSSNTQAGNGDTNCWDAVSCNNKTSDCTWNYCPCENCSSVSPEFTFCVDRGYPFSYGPNANLFVNWRKYLCQKRLKESNWKPELNEIENMRIRCSTDSGDCNNSTPNPSESDACDHIWKFEYVFNSDNTSFKQFGCGSQTQKSIDIKFSKYEMPTSGKFNQAWRPFETKYQPNPGRNLDRRHIVITARGIDG